MARIGATNNLNTGLRIGSTGAENTIGVEGRGGNLTGDVTSGAKKMFAVGDYARVLGVKPGTAVDLSSYDPATVKAVQELAWKKNKQAADENKAKLKKTAIIIGAAALGGAALGAAGGAAGAAATPGAAAVAPTAATGAGLGGAAATGATTGIGAGISAGMAQGAAAGMGAAGAGAAGAAGASAATGAGLAAGTGATTTGLKALASKVFGGGSSGYMKAGNAALQAYGAYDAAKENEKLAKEAGKSKDTKRSPYYNEAISQLMQYILAEQARVYQRRMQGYGARPGDYTPFAQLLQQIPSSYRG